MNVAEESGRLRVWNVRSVLRLQKAMFSEVVAVMQERGRGVGRARMCRELSLESMSSRQEMQTRLSVRGDNTERWKKMVVVRECWCCFLVINHRETAALAAVTTQHNTFVTAFLSLGAQRSALGRITTSTNTNDPVAVSVECELQLSNVSSSNSPIRLNLHDYDWLLLPARWPLLQPTLLLQLQTTLSQKEREQRRCFFTHHPAF